MARQLARLALASQGAVRRQLLALAADCERLPLTEAAKADLLRNLHLGLVLQEKPAQDTTQALAGAVLHSLAAVQLNKSAPPSARVLACGNNYLPWLKKTGARIDIRPDGTPQPAELRAAAARTLHQLSGLE